MSRAPLAIVVAVMATIFYACASSMSPTPTPPNCTLSLSPSTLTVGDSATVASITVTGTSSCAWTATSNATFVTITAGSSGSGSGTINISVAANTTGASRTGTITIGTQTFTVTQQSCVYTLSATSVTVSAEGGPATLTVSAPSACTWTVASNSALITLTSPTLNVGTAPVTFTLTANTSVARSGTLTVAGQTVTVFQTGPGGFDNCVTYLCNSHVSPCPGLNISGAGGTGELNLVAPNTCTWSGAGTVPWVAVYSTSPVNQPYGTGDGHFGFSVAPNTTSIQRVGGIVAGGMTFSIAQDACAYTLSTTAISVAATGGSATVAVTTACAAGWTASSDASFITVSSGGAGTGNGTVTFAIAANTGAARSGTVTIAGQTVTVTQAGQSPQSRLSVGVRDAAHLFVRATSSKPGPAGTSIVGWPRSKSG